MKKARVILQIDPKELHIEVYANKGALVNNKFGVEGVRITHLKKDIATDCDWRCQRHPDISTWNIDRRKCAMSQLKQKLNEKL